MSEHAVSVENVTVTFGDLTVIDGATVAVEPGTVAGLIGPNGSGKTTLLRAIAGLLEPDSGTIELAAGGSRAVGYLAQAPAFRPQFTVQETLSFYASLVEGETDVDGAIDRVGLGGVPDRRVEALSGGMTRLLGLAQATIGKPGLLVLDEPSSGLDPMMTAHITDVVAELSGDDRAVLLATHDLDSIEAVADEVIVIDRGRIVETGSPAELLASTGTDDLAAAMGELVSGESGEVSTRESPVASAPGDDA